MIEDLNLKATTSYIVEELMREYGCDITLDKLLIKLTVDKGYKCPKCHGRGFVTAHDTIYYTGSRGYKIGDADIKCDLCKGTGFTDKPMKPKMVQVQDGWEEV